MAKYIAPEQPKAMQFFDIVCLVVAIFAALWLPLKMGWAGSIALGAWMLFDWFKTDSAYSEEVLTSSREGEIEAVQEKHKV